MKVIISLLLIIVLVLLFIFTVVAPDFDFKFTRKKKREKCFELFSKMYPLSPLCPGKEFSTLCDDCPHSMDNYRYKISKLPKDELDINGF